MLFNPRTMAAGFDVRAVQSDRRRRGLGLIGMQERLSAIGGTLSIDSTPGRRNETLDSGSDAVGVFEWRFVLSSRMTMPWCARV